MHIIEYIHIKIILILSIIKKSNLILLKIEKINKNERKIIHFF